MSTKSKKTPVMVTTEHRGVFFGYINGEKVKDGSITIARARCCVYWSAAMRGFMGLAATGPDSACKIGPQVPSLTLAKVTSVIECTAEAAENWEAGPWQK